MVKKPTGKQEKGQMKKQGEKNRKQKDKMPDLNLTITIITLNVNSRNGSKRLKVKRWQMIYHANINQKKQEWLYK